MDMTRRVECWTSALLLSIAGAMLSGCSGGSGGPGAPQGAALTNAPRLQTAKSALSRQAPARETNAVAWQSVLLDLRANLLLPAPPAPSSPQGIAERDELRALQANRSQADIDAVAYWNTGAVVRWNEIARQMVIQTKTPPPKASRVYALVSVAQYDALLAASLNKLRFRRPTPAKQDSTLQPLVNVPDEPSYPSDHAVVAGASAEVLKYLYPADAAALDEKARLDGQSRLVAGVSFRSDVTAGDTLGRNVAKYIIARAKTDGSDAAVTGPTQPVGAGYWPGVNPLLPGWGKVKPWLAPSMKPYAPAAAPKFGSTAYNAGLAEVRRISDTRTPEQLAIATFWSDAGGTYTPPGHWNLIAADLILAANLSELRAARVMSLMNMAVADAGVCCWDSKFQYWLMRPSQADPAITLPIGLPNFPSYTSGHASFSGAASTVLGELFPSKKAEIDGFANEAAVSRLYGGIHYRFDNDNGLKSGRAIGALAVRRARSDGAPAIRALIEGAVPALEDIRARRLSGGKAGNSLRNSVEAGTNADWGD